MESKGGYRQRIYDSYVSKHFQFGNDLSGEGYENESREFEKNYLRFLPPQKNANILDIACGPGYFPWFLKKHGYTNYTGIDLSVEQVQLARNKLPGYEFVVADAFKYLSESQSRYDLVFASHVLEHLYKDEVLGMLDLVYNALNPGGIFIAAVPNCGSPLFGNHSRYVDFTHETGFTPESAKQILRVAGFNVKYCGAVRKARFLRDITMKTLDLFVGRLSKKDISVFPELYFAGERQ